MIPTERDVWVVVPSYNEGERLSLTIYALLAQDWNIVVVDDGSKELATEKLPRSEKVWVLRHLFNCGQGAAIQTGMEFSLKNGARFVATFDADGQHSVEDLHRMIGLVRERKADVALGSRFLGRALGLPFTRRIVLKLGIAFTRLFSGIRVTDVHNGIRVFSRVAALRIDLSHNRMAHASEILDQIRQHELKFCEVPVTIRYSDATLAKGQSSWNAIRIAGQLLLGRIMR